jgi:ABC-type glutathione transport system ATPase component
MKGDIKIKIIGPVGCGKSTVGQIILKALFEAGLTPEFTSQEPQQLLVEQQHQKKRLKNIKKNSITVEEIITREIAL